MGSRVLVLTSRHQPCSLFLQREGAEDILDFWLDVQQHENLCRAYFKDVRKSGRTIKEDWPEYWDYTIAMYFHRASKPWAASFNNIFPQYADELAAEMEIWKILS